jgi:hypothetical protein
MVGEQVLDGEREGDIFLLGKRQKAKGKRQKAKGKRQKAKGKTAPHAGLHLNWFSGNILL